LESVVSEGAVRLSLVFSAGFSCSGMAGFGEPVWVHALSHRPVKIITSMFKRFIFINDTPQRVSEPIVQPPAKQFVFTIIAKSIQNET